MDPAHADPRPPDAPDFIDGLGERTLLTDAASGESVEVLQLRAGLTSVPSFEFALRERTARLANFRHQAFARVRRVDRTPAGLAVVSDHVAGFRLSQMLRVAEERGLAVDTNASLSLIRQLLPALVLLHENARDVAHGALGPDRLIVTPHARLVVAEYVLGSALEQLQLSHDRLWRDYRIPMPPSAGAPRFDHRADVMQLGVTSLALILGRTLHEEDGARFTELLAESTETSAGGARQPLSQGLRGWLARALQVDQRHPFVSARDAQVALDQVIASDNRYVASTVAVEAFISRCVDSIIELGEQESHAAPGAASSPLPAAAPVPTAAPAVPAKPAPPAPVQATPPAATPVVQPVPARPAVPAPVPAALVPPVQPTTSAPAEALAPVQSALSRPVQSAPEPAVADPADVAEMFSRRESPPIETPVMPPPAPVDRDPVTAASDHTGLDLDKLQAVFTRPAMAGHGTLFGGDPDVPEEPMTTLEPEPGARKRASNPWLRTAAILAVVLATGAAGVVGARRYLMAPAPGPVAVETGTLLVQSAPEGVPVVVDGEPRGLTPLQLTLKPGAHILELRGKGLPRVMPVTITAGAQISQFVEFAEAVTPTTGQLDVRSDPPGARVSIDGQPVGTAPLVVPGLSPGEHRILLERDEARVQHTVTIEPGVTASLLAPLNAAPAGPASGWIAVSAPFAMQIFENGRLVGSTETDKIMVAAGRHVLDLVNESLSYRVTHVVQVQPGKTAAIGIELPNGVVNLNAQPWAEVWIDDRRIGETPIGNLSLPIGAHEVVFRHPQFGEKRQAISVTPAAPVRLSIDMRK